MLLAVATIFNGLNQFSFFSSSSAFSSATTAFTVLDYAGVTLMGGLFLSSFILASRVNTTKLALPLSLAMVVFSAFVAAIFSNTFAALATGPLAVAAQSLPFFTRILKNLPVLILVSGVLVNIALYSRVGQTTGGRRALR